MLCLIIRRFDRDRIDNKRKDTELCDDDDEDYRDSGSGTYFVLYLAQRFEREVTQPTLTTAFL